MGTAENHNNIIIHRQAIYNSADNKPILINPY